MFIEQWGTICKTCGWQTIQKTLHMKNPTFIMNEELPVEESILKVVLD